MVGCGFGEFLMKRGFFSLRRLRWKLTLSYTLVTVVALLMAELLLFAAFIALLSSPVLPGFIVQELKETVVPRVEPALSEAPPDTEVLREGVLQETWLSFDGGNVEQGAGKSYPALGPGDGYLFVVDDEQRLLASDRGLESSIEGKRLDSGQFPGLDPVLTAALEGEEDPWSLQARSPDDRQLYAVAPVKGEDGRVLGAVVAAFGLPDLTVLTLALFGAGAVALTVPAAIIGTIFGFVTAWSLTRRLRRLARAARAWSQGDFSVTARDRSNDELVRLAQKELNVLIHQMRPATLEGKGLSAALGDYAAEWSRRSDITAEVHVRGQREVPLEVEQALFRVAQEALANVSRHSGAKSVEVDLVYDPDRLMLRVTDDGRGFDPKKNTGDGFGLQSMSERVATLGGYVDVESAPGKGTRVVCACPLDDSSIEKGRGT